MTEYVKTVYRVHGHYKPMDRKTAGTRNFILRQVTGVRGTISSLYFNYARHVDILSCIPQSERHFYKEEVIDKLLHVRDLLHEIEYAFRIHGPQPIEMIEAGKKLLEEDNRLNETKQETSPRKLSLQEILAQGKKA